MPERTLTLREKQSLFVELVAVLIAEANRLGYALTFGEAYRSPEEAARLAALGKGIKASLHTQRLAVDFNLFIGGKYITRSEHYLLLGEFWEGLNPLCRWGGRFKRPDGNHFSLAHGGKA